MAPLPVTRITSRSGAAIDIGTNSFHLVIARVKAGRSFETMDREKEMVRLGAGPGNMKRLTADAMDRGVRALERFRQLADAVDAPVAAVATNWWHSWSTSRATTALSRSRRR